MFEEKRQGAVNVISGGERLSGESVAELAEVLSNHVENGRLQVVLNLQGVALLDSAGVEALLDYQEKFQRKGGAMKLAGVGSLCSEVLKITGAASYFETFDDTGSAVRSFVL